MKKYDYSPYKEHFQETHSEVYHWIAEPNACIHEIVLYLWEPEWWVSDREQAQISVGNTSECVTPALSLHLQAREHTFKRQ